VDFWQRLQEGGKGGFFRSTPKSLFCDFEKKYFEKLKVEMENQNLKNIFFQNHKKDFLA
jgi:hypothetical protein